MTLIRLMGKTAALAACVWLSGCFASARHVAKVRPETVRPVVAKNAHYRVNKVQIARVDDAVAKKIVSEALLRNYPEIFTTSKDGIPIDIIVEWNATMMNRGVAHNLISFFLVPAIMDEETIFDVSVSLSYAGQRMNSKISVARSCEAWETFLLPVGFIPVPGKSNLPRTFTFCGIGSSGSIKFDTKNCGPLFNAVTFIFDPRVDGDVIAAATVKNLNRINRKSPVGVQEKKGGAK